MVLSSGRLWLGCFVYASMLLSGLSDAIELDFELSPPHAEITDGGTLRISYRILDSVFPFKEACPDWIAAVSIETLNSHFAEDDDAPRDSLCKVCEAEEEGGGHEATCTHSLHVDGGGGEGGGGGGPAAGATDLNVTLQFLYARKFFAAQSTRREAQLLVPVWQRSLLVPRRSSAPERSERDEERSVAEPASWIARYAALHARIMRGDVPEVPASYALHPPCPVLT